MNWLLEVDKIVDYFLKYKNKTIIINLLLITIIFTFFGTRIFLMSKIASLTKLTITVDMEVSTFLNFKCWLMHNQFLNFMNKHTDFPHKDNNPFQKISDITKSDF